MPCYKNGYANVLPTGRKLKAIKMTDLQNKILIYILFPISTHDEIFFSFFYLEIKSKNKYYVTTVHTLEKLILDLMLEFLITYLLKKLKPP